MAQPGDLDTSFDSNGKKAINFGGTDAAQPSSCSPTAGSSSPAAARRRERLLRRAAARATACSTRPSARPASARSASAATDECAYAAALQPDGRIVLAGDSELRVAVTRLNANGALDTSFSGDGKKLFSWGPISRAMAVLVLPNGKILLGGFSGPEGGNIQVARLNAGRRAGHDVRHRRHRLGRLRRRRVRPRDGAAGQRADPRGRALAGAARWSRGCGRTARSTRTSTATAA